MRNVASVEGSDPVQLIAAAAAEDSPASPEIAVRPLALLSSAHFFIDLYSSALGALQPLLVVRHALNLMQAGVLGGLLSFSSSVMQPLYGYISDRFGFRYLTVLAPAITGIFISSLGAAPSYGA